LTLTWHKEDSFLYAGDKQILCWSKVRNELNGLRPKKGIPDLVYSMGENGRKEYPVMPRSFPVGVWQITGFNDHSKVDAKGMPEDGYLYPVFIATNAYAMLDIWDLDENGGYLKNTREKCKDYFYGLHFSTSEWTQGCIRIGYQADVRWLWDNCQVGDQFIVTE
jgi:hypothetical protein